MEFGLNKAIGILAEKLESWLESITAMLPNAFVAILILSVFFLLAKVAKMVFNRVMRRFIHSVAISNLFSNIVYLITLGIGVIMALNVMHLDQTVTSLLAGAGIIGLALGFAFQDITANFISGILMAIRKPIRVGDIIQTQDYFGTVEKINLRVTIIQTFQGLHVIIPNKDVFQSPVTNYTRTHIRRIDLDVGISYGEDLEKVKDVTINAISQLPYLLPDKEVNVFYKEFGDSSINFIAMFWVHYPNEPGFLKARSDAIMTIKKAFDENNITIPFPIRTLDFGIKGGQNLSNMKVHVVNGHQKQDQQEQ